MGITYVVDRGLQVVLTDWEGSVTGQEVIDYWQRLLSDPDAGGCKGSVVDMTKGTIEFTGDQLVGVAHVVASQVASGGKWRSGVIAKDALRHGVSRQFSALTGEVVEIEVFNDADAALAWVLGGE